MGSVSNKAVSIARFAGEVIAETLWPTRCAICDTPGDVLCEQCACSLPFLDWWRACPQCGSAYARVQCDLCNPVALQRIGRESLPFQACASATLFCEPTGRLVRVYKDQGERRLAGRLAAFMARSVVPSWNFDAVTFVPATKAAYRYRGFDHCELLANELSARLSVECLHALGRPHTRDQRSLGGWERIANLQRGFASSGLNVTGKRLLLVDDVFTTGATLCAATDALLEAGAHEVFCLTFARV